MRKIILILVLFIFSLWGHNVKPAYLEINEKVDNRYEVKWKVPLLNKQKVAIKPHFPKGCIEQKGSRYGVSNEVLKISYWSLTCKEDIIGKVISIDNLEQSLMDVLVHFNKGDDFTYINRLSSSNRYFTVEPYPTISNTVESYLVLGIKHILMGFDHLLFVLGLMLIIGRLKLLLLTISSFTLAHSITLGLSVLEVLFPTPAFIEVLIALSIVILAVEIIYSYHGKYGFFARYPWMIAFFFGLIHGFGFATVLMELGIPKEYLLPTLISFNMGIEFGQLLFISFLLGLYILLKKRLSSNMMFKGKIILTYLIGIIACSWMIERVYS